MAGILSKFWGARPRRQACDERIARFLSDLAKVAPRAGFGSYAFVDAQGDCRGWAQLIEASDGSLTIHRLWTLASGKGNGSAMLRTLCALADQHGVELRLKALPFGRKPHPFSDEALASWYRRHGFEGTARKMARKPGAREGVFA